MPIIQTRQKSDIEKRLKLLRQQVYGKSEEKKLEVRSEKMDKEVKNGNQEIQDIPLQYHTSNITHPSTDARLLQSDITYLRHDLMKITTFAAIAFALQGILFYLLTNNIVKLPF